ncbi:MAG: hypothetical protein ACK53Z_00240 [Betaproteobacteria bacterium]|jgi:hypothetical protein
MTFDDWLVDHGDYLNDSDDAARAAKLMARRAWDAAVAAERERCKTRAIRLGVWWKTERN